jgi:hypothetical protein
MQDSKQLLLVHVASSTSVHDNGYNILTYDLRNCGLSGEADDARCRMSRAASS